MRRPKRPRSMWSSTVAHVRSCESPADHFIKFVLTPAIRKWAGRYDRITEGAGDEWDPNRFIAQISLHLDQVVPTELLGPPRRCSDFYEDDEA